MRSYILIIFVLIFSNSLLSQKKAATPYKINIVNLPDTVRYMLACAEIQKTSLTKDDSSYMALSVYNLEKPNDFKFKDGIYSYRVMGPHFNRKVFIVNERKLYILSKYYVDDVIKEYSEVIRNSNMNSLQKIKYLKVLYKYLLEEYESGT